MATDYSKKTNAELVEILKSRSLPHTGKKAEMVARLQEDDANKAKAEAPAAPATTKTDNTTEDVIDWEDDDAPAADTAAAKPAAETAAGTAAAGDKPQQETTTAAAAAEAPKEESQGAAAGQEASGDAAPAAAEEKPAPDYTMGLPITEMEEELKKRKARAEKFGITDESKAAIEEAERKLERAKRFGTGPGEKTEVGVGRLDEALPSEKPRKRGRENDQGGRGGKRRDFGGRNRFQRRGRGGNQNGRGQGQQRSNGNASNDASSGLSEKDRLAMEARKKRFGAAA